MSPTDRATFQWLAHCGYSNTAGPTFVTQIRLSALIGISMKSISRTIDKLERLGIVKRQQQAIRKRAGRTLYGAMQNEFTDAFKALIQCPDLRSIAVADRPCQI